MIEIQTQLSMYIHGTTRSKELIKLLHKFGVGIAYKDVLDLEAAWAVTDVKMVGFLTIHIYILSLTIQSPVCPAELKEGVPGIAVMDNDDFREDTLTGKIYNLYTHYKSNNYFT